jgi:hypothetical protein
MKAILAQIDLGFAIVEGLMLPDGTYAVSVPQIVKLFSLNSVNAARDIKTLIKKSTLVNPVPIKNREGQEKHALANNTPVKEPEKQRKASHSKGSSLFIEEELFSANTENDVVFDIVRQTQIEGQRHKVNIISLEDFSKVIYELQKKGNPVADAFLRALIIEGIERRFDKAFGNFVEEQERNSRIQLGMERILARTEWTDILMKRSLELYGVKPKAEDYRRWTIYVNKMLFGQPHFQCDRDNMTEWQQRLIKSFETTASFKAERYPKATPEEILTMTVNVFL